MLHSSFNSKNVDNITLINNVNNSLTNYYNIIQGRLKKICAPSTIAHLEKYNQLHALFKFKIRDGYFIFFPSISRLKMKISSGICR